VARAIELLEKLQESGDVPGHKLQSLKKVLQSEFCTAIREVSHRGAREHTNATRVCSLSRSYFFFYLSTLLSFTSMTFLVLALLLFQSISVLGILGCFVLGVAAAVVVVVAEVSIPTLHFLFIPHKS